MYSDLNKFERKLGQFADKIEIIVFLEIGGKITSEEAYERIKELYKKLKKSHKKEINSSHSENESV
tara:strand:- start:87 stop:284 length:198 start_codon:yes stop_codon:yes gene_type:complete